MFELLAGRAALSTEEIATELGGDGDAVARLLGALASIDLLVRDGDGKYSNSPAATEFLVPGRPESMTTSVSLIGQWNQTFGQLAESVRSGQPARDPRGSPR